jgi:hypothetical protein
MDAALAGPPSKRVRSANLIWTEDSGIKNRKLPKENDPVVTTVIGQNELECIPPYPEI